MWYSIPSMQPGRLEPSCSQVHSGWMVSKHPTWMNGYSPLHNSACTCHFLLLYAAWLEPARNTTLVTILCENATPMKCSVSRRVKLSRNWSRSEDFRSNWSCLEHDWLLGLLDIRHPVGRLWRLGYGWRLCWRGPGTCFLLFPVRALHTPITYIDERQVQYYIWKHPYIRPSTLLEESGILW